MPRFSITLTDEQNERIEELVENGEYGSKNAVVQDWLADAEKMNQLESELERCRRARRQLLEQRSEDQELVRYAESEREAAERREKRRQANDLVCCQPRRSSVRAVGVPDSQRSLVRSSC